MVSRAPLRPVEGARLGAAVALGWVLVDLVLFASTGRPRNALELLPSSLVAIALAGLVGLLVRRPRLWLAAFVLCALGLGANPLLASLGEPPLSLSTARLPEAALLLLTSYGLAVLVRDLRPSGHLLVALALGLAACLGAFAARQPWCTEATAMALLAALSGLAALLHGAGRALVLVTGTVLVALILRPRLRESRPTRGDLPPVAGPLEAPSAVFIVLDTVRADHLQAYGYERETTPGLDAFARDEATLYTDCRATAPFTLASHASMFTGLFPSEHHAARPSISATPMRDDVPTLAERLRDAGYQTAAIVANHAYLLPQLGIDRGFEHYDNRSGGWMARYLALGQLLGGDALRVGRISHREASDITDAALAWLDHDRREQPFFLFLNYLDAHSPYYPQSPYSRLWEDGRQPARPLRVQGPIRSLLYDRELAYLDDQVTRLLEGLKRRGLFQDSLVIVTSDHGDDLSEHGIPEHCWQLYDSLVHVPLYVKPPGGRRRERAEEPLTVAELYRLTQRELGLDPGQRAPRHTFVAEWYPVVPVSESYGRWAAGMDFDVDAQRVTWLEDGKKWIVSSSGKVELYDLESDPDELTPLFVDEERAEDARRRAAAWWRARPLPDAKDDGTLGREHLDDLEALGYG